MKPISILAASYWLSTVIVMFTHAALGERYDMGRVRNGHRCAVDGMARVSPLSAKSIAGIAEPMTGIFRSTYTGLDFRATVRSGYRYWISIPRYLTPRRARGLHNGCNVRRNLLGEGN